MIKLRKHFSAQFVNLVAKSDQLVSDIEELRKHGYKLLPGDYGCSGDCDVESKIIRVGRCKLICRMYIIAHEVGHGLNDLDESMKKLSPHRTSLNQYVYAEIRDEYRAILYAIDRLREIYADRPREKHHFDEWSKLAKAGKWARLIKEIRESEVTSRKTRKKFSDYWADQYKKEKRAAARKRKKTLEKKKSKDKK